MNVSSFYLRVWVQPGKEYNEYSYHNLVQKSKGFICSSIIQLKQYTRFVNEFFFKRVLLIHDEQFITVTSSIIKVIKSYVM